MAAPMDEHKLSVKEHNINKRINWYEVMDNMIGENRQRTAPFMPRSAIPQVLKSPEEVRVQNAFDSCIFKTIISGTMG